MCNISFNFQSIQTKIYVDKIKFVLKMVLTNLVNFKKQFLVNSTVDTVVAKSMLEMSVSGVTTVHIYDS